MKGNDLVRDGLALACAERACNASFEARPIRKFRARLQYNTSFEIALLEEASSEALVLAKRLGFPEARHRQVR